jgi:hypothetical protein
MDEKLQKSVIDLLEAIECDYGKINVPGQLYQRDMTDNALSSEVIKRLIDFYESGYFLIKKG